MSYAEPLITIALIALALIFNRPIGNALLMIGESPMSKSKPARLTTSASGGLSKPEPFVYVSPQEPDRICVPTTGDAVRFVIQVGPELRYRPATVVACSQGYGKSEIPNPTKRKRSRRGRANAKE